MDDDRAVLRGGAPEPGDQDGDLGLTPALHFHARKLGRAFQTRGAAEAIFGPPDRRPGDPHTAGWRWDGGTLTIRTPADGHRRLFVSVASGEIWVSDSALALAAARGDAEPDMVSVATMLLFTGPLGTDTPFHHIRAVGPGTTMRWAGSSPERVRTPTRFAVEEITRDAAIDRYIDVTRAAVAAYPQAGREAITLSGGRDSRTIALALAARPERAAAFTSSHYTNSQETDLRVARAVAEHLRFPFTPVRGGVDRVAEEIAKTLIVDAAALAHSWAGPLARAVAPFERVWDGLCGDVLFGRTGLQRTARRLRANPRRDATTIMAAALADRLAALTAMLAPATRERLNLAAAAERLGAALATFAGWTNPIQGFYYHHQTLGAMAAFPFRILPHDRVAVPLDDPAVVRFGMELPYFISADPHFQGDALARIAPELAPLGFAEVAGALASVDRIAEAGSAATLLASIRNTRDLFTDALIARAQAGDLDLAEIQVLVHLALILGRTADGRWAWQAVWAEDQASDGPG